jgi:hypothetical protein
MGHREKCGWREEAESWVRAQREQPSTAGDDLKGTLACRRYKGCVGHVDATETNSCQEIDSAPPLSALLASDLLPPSAKSASPTIGRTTLVISTLTAAARLPTPGRSVHTRHAAFTAGPSLSKPSIATSVATTPPAAGTGRSHDGDARRVAVVGVGDAQTSCRRVPLDDSQRTAAAADSVAPCSQ